MQVHTLSLHDFGEEEYTLIAIHTALEDYRLAYLLNKNIQTRFFRLLKDVTIKKKEYNTSFATYNYLDTFYDHDWVLVANSSKIENKKTENQLLLAIETKTYLLPEKKKVDFFIKISGEINSNTIENTLKKIKNIEQVLTAYSVDKKTLKSKHLLIL